MTPVKGQFDLRDAMSDNWYPDAGQRVYTCDNCGGINFVTFYDARIYAPGPDGGRLRETEQGGYYEAWTPTPGQRADYPDVPKHIADAAIEATLCLSTGAHRAVASLARAIVEATAKDKGITVRGIEKKIDALAAAGHLRSDITAAAHEIRHMGNDMAHGDFIDSVTADQAADMIELMDEVLQEVYQGPARVTRIRTAREAKKAT